MPGGISLAELDELLAPLLASEALIGASIACFNPEKDPGGACGRALVEALRPCAPSPSRQARGCAARRGSRSSP